MLLNTKIRKLAYVAAIASICIGLTACGANKEKEADSVISDRIAEASLNDANEAKVEGSLPAFHTDNEYQDAQELQSMLLAEIPDKNIRLYSKPDDGVALHIGEAKQEYDWLYMTPRSIYPVMELQDFDMDGSEELAVILSIGSGTGISVEQLRIVEMDDKSLQSGTDQPFAQDFAFKEVDYAAQINELVGFTLVEKNEEWFGIIKIEDQVDTVSLATYASPEGGAIHEQLAFGSIVSFYIEDHALKMELGVGITQDKVAIPIYFGSINADVNYKEGAFSLTNLKFEQIQT